MPVTEIPIEFEYEGISFKGHFYQAYGGGGSWHLNLNGYNYGSIVKYATGWKWCPNIHNHFTELYMQEFFIKTVEDWLRQNGPGHRL